MTAALATAPALADPGICVRRRGTTYVGPLLLLLPSPQQLLLLSTMSILLQHGVDMLYTYCVLHNECYCDHLMHYLSYDFSSSIETTACGSCTLNY